MLAQYQTSMLAQYQPNTRLSPIQSQSYHIAKFDFSMPEQFDSGGTTSPCLFRSSFFVSLVRTFTLPLSFQLLWLRRHGFPSLLYSYSPIHSPIPHSHQKSRRLFLVAAICPYSDKDLATGEMKAVAKAGLTLLDEDARPNSACGTSSSYLSISGPVSVLSLSLPFSLPLMSA